VAQQVAGAVEAMDDLPGEHLGADLVQPELERRRDAEAAARSPDRPEEVWPGLYPRRPAAPPRVVCSL
jgi:hypothetical protein